MKNIYTNTNSTFTAANGETVRYSEVFEAIRKSVEFYGRTMGRDLSEEELEDLFGDCVLKAIKYSGSYDPSKSTPKAWARQIVANTQKDAYRRHCRDAAMFIHPISYRNSEDEAAESYFDTVSGGRRADQEIETREALERIYGALGPLSDRQRRVMALQIDTIKPKKMAEIIGCTPDAASILLHRARKAVRKTLGKGFLSENGIAA